MIKLTWELSDLDKAFTLKLSSSKTFFDMLHCTWLRFTAFAILTMDTELSEKAVKERSLFNLQIAEPQL